MTLSLTGGSFAYAESLSELIKRIDLASLVEAYAGAGKRTGSGFVFSCPNPNHADRNPSFTVSQDHAGKEWARCQSACAWHGDALDLVKWLEGLDTKQAKEKLLAHLGDFVPSTYKAGAIKLNRTTPTEAQRLKVAEDTSRRLEGDSARELMKRFLAGRGWPSRVAEEFSLEIVLDSRGNPRVRFPFYSPDALGGWVLTHWQDRAINTLKEGDRKWLSASTPKTIYNLRAIEAKDPRVVVICEGCPDTITASLALEGLDDVAAIGVTGAGSWRREDSKLLDGLLVVIAADDDEAGRRLEESVCSSTRSKVRLVRPTHNDLDETAQTLGLDAVRALLLLAVQEVKS
jgi:hypothetical protein